EPAMVGDRLRVDRRSGYADALHLANDHGALQDFLKRNGAASEIAMRRSVQVVDEKDGSLFGGLWQGIMKPLVPRAADGTPRWQIEFQDRAPSKKRRHLSIGNALRETPHDRALPNAHLTHQHWVLGLEAAQNVNDAIEFGLTSHQRRTRFHSNKIRARLR